VELKAMKTTRVWGWFILLLFARMLTAQEPPLLRYSIVGSSSCDKKPCYDEVISNLSVQKMLLGLAAGSQSVNDVEAALKGAGVSLDDILRLKLIRRDGDRFSLNFPLFTAGDVQRIRASSEVYAGSLADAMLAHRQEIEAALQNYDLPSVDRKAVAYFVLGCASLDWGGLDLTAAKGYRKVSEKRPDGNYVPDAEEATPLSLERIYWGSHNSEYDGIRMTSFGDHFSNRYTLPDLFWRLPDRVAETDFPEELKPSIESMLHASPRQRVMYITRMLVSLRDGEKTLPELAQAAKLQVKKAEPMVRMLLALEFVASHGDRYQASIPVLTKRDEAMYRRLLSIGNAVMDQWLAVNYPKMKAELHDLSFTRSGVPFEDGFTMIWHYLFGIANRKLVEAGLFADPYAANRKYKGSIPAVSEISSR
jgi:hypothetical protein